MNKLIISTHKTVGQEFLVQFLIWQFCGLHCITYCKHMCKHKLKVAAARAVQMNSVQRYPLGILALSWHCSEPWMIGKIKLAEYYVRKKSYITSQKLLAFQDGFSTTTSNWKGFERLWESCHVALVCLRIAQTSMSVLWQREQTQASARLRGTWTKLAECCSCHTQCSHHQAESWVGRAPHDTAERRGNFSQVEAWAFQHLAFCCWKCNSRDCRGSMRNCGFVSVLG